MTSTRHTWILIHGTWAAPKHKALLKKIGKNIAWYQEDHPSYQALKKVLPTNTTVISLIWTGNNNHEDRQEAAQALVRVIKKEHARGSSISIVGHSHGGTIALLASQLLAHTSTPFIYQLFTLGVPVHTEWYPEAHKACGSIFNLFSYGDVIQPVGGMFERMLPETTNSYNIQVTLDEQCPSHTALYKPAILTTLPLLGKLTQQPKQHYRLDTYSHKASTLQIDQNREKEIKIDKDFMAQLITCWIYGRKKQKNGSAFTFSKDWISRLWDRRNEYTQKILAAASRTLSSSKNNAS